MKLIPIQVDTIDLAQQVRMIRNSVCRYMTRHNQPISDSLQTSWFQEHKDTFKDRLFLYMNEHYSYVGFSYITQDHNSRFWGTLALYPEFHARGYGTQIYAHMKTLVDPLWLEIFADNNPSIIAALKNDFEICAIGDKVITLMYTKVKKDEQG